LGLNIENVSFPSRYGGNIRVVLSGSEPFTNLNSLLAQEKDFSIQFMKLQTYFDSWKLNGTRVFSELTSTVLHDENYTLRSSLETWQNQMVFTNYEVDTALGNRSAAGGATTTGTATPAGLYGTIEIYQLDETGASVPNGSYRLVNCWPSDISAIDLSYDTTDAVEDFTVTWTYDYYENGFGTETAIPAIKAAT
jgi:hypothetical protein